MEKRGILRIRDKTEENMKAIITVIGKDAVGILAKVSDVCAQSSVVLRGFMI